MANFKLVLLNVIGKTEVKNKETTVQDVGLEDEIWTYEPQHTRYKLVTNKHKAEEMKYMP